MKIQKKQISVVIIQIMVCLFFGINSAAGSSLDGERNNIIHYAKPGASGDCLSLRFTICYRGINKW